MRKSMNATALAVVLFGVPLAALADTSDELVPGEPVVSSAAEIMTTIAESDPALEVTTDAKGDVDGMVMLSDVLFDYKDATLAEAAQETLANMASKLSDIGALEVVGHTDSIGSKAYNLDLGQARAESVLAWLVENGIDPEKITASSAGESQPVAANTTDTGADDPEGRAKNRRVELRIVDSAEEELPSEDLALNLVR